MEEDNLFLVDSVSFDRTHQLNRKEILMALKKMGYTKLSELKKECRFYEKYFLVTLEMKSF